MLIPRGFHGDQEVLDKPITNPSRKNKRGFPPDRKRVRKINSYNFCVVPVCHSGERQKPEGNEKPLFDCKFGAGGGIRTHEPLRDRRLRPALPRPLIEGSL